MSRQIKVSTDGRRPRRIARLSTAVGLATTLGASALALGAAPAMASAANCANNSSGTAAPAVRQSDGNYILSPFHQVWTKHSRACEDFYLTHQGSRASYGGFFKSTSQTQWRLGARGFVSLGAGSDGIEGQDMVTNLLVGTQLDIGTTGGGQSVSVAF
jgi:hypothetical protein